MIYIIQGQEECFIKNKIDEIINTNQGEIIQFEGSDKSFSIDMMLDACMSNSLFSDKTIVLVNQPYFFIKKIEDKELEILEKYVQNPIYETELILYTYANNFNSRLKAYKLVSENAHVIRCDSLDHKNFPNYLNQRLNEEKLKLNNDSVRTLSMMCKNNATLLNQNIEILKLYPEEINSKVISKLCTADTDYESFDLINALVNKDVTKSISLERLMLRENDSVLGIISLLSGQLRFLYHVAYLSSIGKTKAEIMDITSSKEYRISMALKTLENLSMQQIIKLLNDLSILDCQSKSDNSISDVSRFELFILNLMNRSTYASN